tara:strand:- start:807 stop:971 length:165 start_codon:yes stop_codon:yes gene_type:complete
MNIIGMINNSDIVASDGDSRTQGVLRAPATSAAIFASRYCAMAIACHARLSGRE